MGSGSDSDLIVCSSNPVFQSRSSPRLPTALALHLQFPRSLPASFGVQLPSNSLQIYRHAISPLYSLDNSTYLKLRISFLEFKFTYDHKGRFLISVKRSTDFPELRFCHDMILLENCSQDCYLIIDSSFNT
ncbi:hypothetical protein WN944_004798 [Citrus x changshan-huyou]|uniref:Uncharacterized protein n=1 Tax=Citrus x changshan-huyou TaxID=2935761 RepID=A0AAP0M242_9ROSI